MEEKMGRQSQKIWSENNPRKGNIVGKLNKNCLIWIFTPKITTVKTFFTTMKSILTTVNTVIPKAQRTNEMVQLTSEFWSFEFSRALLDATQNKSLL